jgi:hypothetical protein
MIDAKGGEERHINQESTQSILQPMLGRVNPGTPLTFEGYPRSADSMGNRIRYSMASSDRVISSGVPKTVLAVKKESDSPSTMS